MLYIKRLLLALATASFLAGCGGGGGGPSTATIDTTTAKDLAVAGTEATKAASESSDVPLFKSGATSTTFNVHDFAKQMAQNMYATTDYSSFVCTGGGTFILVTPDAPSQSSSGTLTFTDCTFTEGLSTIVINGTISVSGTSSSITISANLTVATNGVAESASFRGTCALNGSTIGACSYSASFTGVDGRTYSMANMSVSGDYYSGYSVSGSVTDPNHGVITISTTTPVTFNCLDGRPDNGTIVLTGNGTATVTYDTCTSFIVTVNGVPTTYNWANI